MAVIEFRIRWAAGSNVNFRGSTDWREWDIAGESVEDIETALNERGHLPLGLEEALEASGFEWWVETRNDAS